MVQKKLYVEQGRNSSLYSDGLAEAEGSRARRKESRWVSFSRVFLTTGRKKKLNHT